MDKDVQFLIKKEKMSKEGFELSSFTNYDRDITNAESARNNQLKDTDPRIEKEGFLGVDDLDRLRRRNVKHITTPK